MEDDTRPQRAAARIRDEGDALAEQLNQTTSEDAGGTVSGTRQNAPSPPPEFEIVFEPEEAEHGGH